MYTQVKPSLKLPWGQSSNATQLRKMNHFLKNVLASSYATFSHNFKVLHFVGCKAHHNWISGYRVMKNFSNKIKQKTLNTIIYFLLHYLAFNSINSF